ncbi:MAG: nitrogenase [Bacteroidales bacterium]|nr:nitrogenase [Bacteroidales bacterium]
MTAIKRDKPYSSTRNACKLCTPLGACVAFKGVKGCLPLIHGSQGCATYIRRYMISHYREPVDIASSSFSEDAAIFGGNQLFNTGITNIREQYNPEVIAITSTCLSETIGEDIPRLIHEYRSIHAGEELPAFVNASTPSYSGTHLDGFHEAVLALVKTFGVEGPKEEILNLFPGFVSPEDLRYLKDVLEDFGIGYILLPDYSDSLDNPNWTEYTRIPEGGTSITEIARTARAKASIEFGSVFNRGNLPAKAETRKHTLTAGEYLEKKHFVKNYSMPFPMGIKATDRFFETLEEISGKPTPLRHKRERGRLVDAYVDAHKIVFGKRAIVYGEEDLIIGLVGFLDEIGMDNIMVVSGARSGLLEKKLEDATGKSPSGISVLDDGDFETLRETAEGMKPDIFIGSSKGYYITRKLDIPLIRVGFPIHDRFGAQRVMHLGYKGTQQLFDRIVNALMEYKQEKSNVGYKYM